MNQQASLVQPIIMMVVLFALMYFMLIRPQKKRDKLTRQMLSELVVGDKIVTIGGIIGKITALKDDEIVIETGSAAEKSCVKFQRSSVKEVLKPAPEVKTDAAEVKDDKKKK